MGKVDVDDLSFERRRYSRWAAYGQTKLANLLFSTELQRRAVHHGTDLLAAAAHPGYAATNLTSGPALGAAFLRPLLAVGDRLVGQPDHLGALPQLYVATMPDVQPDDYWGPDSWREQRGTRPRRPLRAGPRPGGRPPPLGAQRGAHRRHLPLARRLRLLLTRASRSRGAAPRGRAGRRPGRCGRPRPRARRAPWEPAPELGLGVVVDHRARPHPADQHERHRDAPERVPSPRRARATSARRRRR